MKPAQILLIIAAVVLAYYLIIKPSCGGLFEGMAPIIPEMDQPGMFDLDNSDAFGTTDEANRRVTNYGVRPEFHKNPYPLGYGCGDCDKSGVPDPAAGNTHVCKNGLPSKRMIDAYGGSHFMLPHMCAAGGDKCGETALDTQLARFWCRAGCAQPESVGLDIRPICTRCGN